jgi:hypothetical protein
MVCLQAAIHSPESAVQATGHAQNRKALPLLYTIQLFHDPHIILLLTNDHETNNTSVVAGQRPAVYSRGMVLLLSPASNNEKQSEASMFALRSLLSLYNKEQVLSLECHEVVQWRRVEGLWDIVASWLRLWAWKQRAVDTAQCMF